MNTTEVTDDLKANFRSWEKGEDPEELANILLSRHSEFSYAEMLKIAREWMGQAEPEPEEPETEPSKDITPPPLVKAYNDLETNFRGWLLDHEDQADRLADMLVDRHPGLNKSLALVLARQWVAPE